MGSVDGMKFENVVLDSIRLSLPQEIWTSESIEKRLEPVYKQFKVSVGRLELMTGIRERRVWSEDFTASHEASRVANQVLRTTQIPAESIDLLIHGGVCRDRLEPATAAYVHQNCELPASTQFMDISNACLGFLNGMLTAASMIDSGMIKAALVVTAETSRNLIDNTVDSVLNGHIDRKKLKQFLRI
jgi:3-oxoacyl-[acyl-carrier-protein] synthase III